MTVRQLSPSPVLGIERFASLEDFRPNEVIGGGISKPLDPKQSSAVRAILAFPASLLVLQRSFARRLETNMGADHGLGMLIPISFEATINGLTFDNSMIGLTRGRTPTIAVEEHPNTYLMLRFNSDMRNRGWADFDQGIASVSVSSDRMQRLRAIILEMFDYASKSNTLDHVREHMHETLVSALDSIFISEGTIRARPRTFEKHRRLVADLDEFVLQNPVTPLYSDQLARTLDVSARTLQTAVNTVHGMGLHHYLLGKRLWSVRRKLKTGSATLSVKSAALAAGFWHMGEFSRTYKMHFGERPSETLARARRDLVISTLSGWAADVSHAASIVL